MEGFDVGSVTAKIKADLSDFTAGMNQAKEQASSLGEHISGIAESIRSFAEGASLVVGAQTVAFGEFGKEAIDIASNFEQSRISLDAFTGSAKRGAQAMSLLNDFAKEAPLIPVADVLAGGKQLIAFGLVKEDLSDLKQKIKEAGELAVATQVPMGVAIDLFARAKEGIFNLREMGQFGITRDELEKFGIEFTKTGSAVNKSELLPALEKLVNTRYGTLFAKEQGTFAGAVQNTKDDLTRLAAGFLGVDAATGNIRNGSLFAELEKGANMIFKFLEAHMAMIEQIGSNKTLQLAIEGLVLALASLAIILPVVIIAFNPMILIVIAIEAVIVALYVAWNTNFLGIRDVTNSVVKEVMHFFNDYLQPLIINFMAFWKQAWPIISAVLVQEWNQMVAYLKLTWDIFYGIIKIGLDLVNGNWKQAWNDIKSLLTNVWNDMNGILGNALNFLRNWGGNVLSALVSPFEQAWGRIQDLMNKIKDALDFTKRHSPSVLDIVQNGVQLVNTALQGITFTPNVSANQIAGNIISPLNSSIATNPNGGMNITIQLPNAIISDPAGATRMAELLGNQIINRLKQNIRF